MLGGGAMMGVLASEAAAAPAALALGGVDETLLLGSFTGDVAARSFGLWVRSSSWYLRGLIGTIGTPYGAIQLNTDTSSRLVVGVYDATIGGPLYIHRWSFSGVSLDAWHHLCITHVKGSAPKLYLDGADFGAGTAAGTGATAGDGAVRVGYHLAASYDAADVRGIFHCYAELSAANAAAIDAAVTNDAAVLAILQAADASADYWPVLSTDDASNGGSIANTGAGSAATPTNTESADLIADVPT